LATFFLAGSILSFFDLKKYNTLFLRFGILIIILLSIFFGYYKMAAPFLLPIFTLMLATLSTSPINRIAKKIGDISYGVYIYGFLVQQTIMNYMHLQPIQLMLISLPITFILAYFSWHLVEKKMLKYKNLIS
jgi:peptidoglycan/LPS O-acetylase OafA/YrhL